MEICKLCNVEFNSKKSLQTHLSRSHSFNIVQLKEYYDLYYKLNSEGLDPFTGCNTQFIGLTQGYSKFDGSKESNRKKIASSTVEYWVKVKGYTKEEAELYLKDKHSRSTKNANNTKKELLAKDPNRKYLGGYGIRKFMLMGYSEEEAKIKYEEAKTRRATNWSNMYLENPDLFKGKRTSQLEYWLNKEYTLEEAKILVCESQTTFSLEKCIKKHGNEEGLRIFNERQYKWKKSLHENFEREGDSRSPSSKFANSIIKELCLHLNIEIPKKEKWIKCKETEKAYSYDFTYGKKIIEFNGDYWHCNPLVYEAEYFNKSKGLTAKEIWQYDSVKNQLAESHDYEVLVVWENEWMKDSKQCIERCIKFLNKKINDRRSRFIATY